MSDDLSDIHQQIQRLRVDLTMMANQSQQCFRSVESTLNTLTSKHNMLADHYQQNFTNIDSNLNALDSKYNTLADQSQKSFANVDKSFANVDSNFNILDSKFNTLDSEHKSARNAMHTGFESIRNDMSNRFTSIKNDMSTRFTSIRNDMDNRLESVRNIMTTRLTFIRVHMDAGFECVKNYMQNEFRFIKNDTDTKLQSMKNSMDAKFNSKFKSLLDETDASTCIKSGNMSVSSGNVSTGNVSVTNDSTDNVSDLDDGAEATSNALEIRNDVRLFSSDSELNAVKMKNDARCDNTVSKMDDLENDSLKVENRVISVVEPMTITSDSDLRLDSNKIVLDTTNDSTLNDTGNKLCNENDVPTVPVIAPVVVESNVTSSVTGETDMTSGGNLTCNMASCEQTTNETLSDRDNTLTIAATTTVLSKDTTAVTSSEPIKIKLVVDSAPPTRVISMPTTESISFSSGNTSAGDISIVSTDIHEKNSVNTQAFEAENTSSQWGHALKKNQNYRYPPRWKKPPKSPIKQGSLSPNCRECDDTYKLYPDKRSLTSSVLHTS